MGIVLAIFIFGFIVFFHELGHFILARKNGIDVDEFWIGMGPTLLHKKIGNTDYCLKLLPIGGACMMGEDEVDDLSEGSFNSKSPWRRISVIAAGPVFNFILAFICSIIFIGIVGVDKPIIGSVTEGSQAYEAGIEAGDKIVKIGGKHIFIFRDIFVYEQIHAGEEQEIARRIKNIENKRISIMQDMANVLNRKPEELTVDVMIEILQKQPKEQEELAKLRAKLKETLAEMKNINEQNQTLITQALEMVEFDMALIKSIRQAPETANYNRQAYNTGDILGSGGFDAKQ